MSRELEKKLMKKWWIKLKYKRWLGIGIFWLLIYKFIEKSDLVSSIAVSLPGREAALLAGMVWGEKGGIGRDFYEYLKNSGLVHIVVVSGANLMMVGKNLIEWSAGYIGRKTAIVMGLGTVLWYINTVGWEIPVIRAGIFMLVFYLAQILGRKFDLGRGLLLTVLIMTLADYRILSDVSFWLSFAAFIGVVLSANKGVWMTTIWVTLMILPIISIKFGNVSLITPVANVAVLFLVEVITIVGFCGSFLFLVWQSLGKVVLGISYPLLRYLLEVIEFSGKGLGVLNFRFNWWMLVGWYLLILGFYARKKV